MGLRAEKGYAKADGRGQPEYGKGEVKLPVVDSSKSPRSAALNMWAAIPLGVSCQTSCISDSYIPILNSSKLQL